MNRFLKTSVLSFLTLPILVSLITIRRYHLGIRMVRKRKPRTLTQNHHSKLDCRLLNVHVFWLQVQSRSVREVCDKNSRTCQSEHCSVVY